MNDKVLDFAEEQHNKMFDTFMKQGFGYLDFPEATMYITLNSFMATKLLRQGITAPTQKQLYDASINACDDVIRFFQEYKAKLMNEEVDYRRDLVSKR